jgi:hypothetical protein
MAEAACWFARAELHRRGLPSDARRFRKQAGDLSRVVRGDCRTGRRAALFDTESARCRLGDIRHIGARFDTEGLLLIARSRLGDI